MAKRHKLPVLAVVQVGSDEFVRFEIRNEQDRVWNGNQFGSGTGVLYAHQNNAASDSQDILRQNFKGMNPQRLVVPLYVDVFSHDGPVPLTEVAEYLSLASKLFIDSLKHGHGPGDSLVLTRIEWSRIRAVSEVPQ